MTEEYDFEYDQNDILALKVSYHEMVEHDRKGFWWGIGSTLLTRFFLKRRTNTLPWIRNSVAVLTGSQVYGFLTSSSKNNYGATAARVNKNASTQLNRILKY